MSPISIATSAVLARGKIVVLALVVFVWLKTASSFSLFQTLHVATCCRLRTFLSSHVVCVHSCFVIRSLASSTICVWMGNYCCESVCLLSLCDALAPQPYGHHSRGEELVPKASGRLLHVVAGFVLRDPSLPAVYLGRSSQSLRG